MPKPKVVAKRVTVSLRQPDVENLAFIAKSTGLTENDSIRKSLATEAAFQSWLSNGSTIMKRDGKSGKLYDLAFV